MTQEERWMTRYNGVVDFIEANHQNLLTVVKNRQFTSTFLSKTIYKSK